jgi:hypothetical protein
MPTFIDRIGQKFNCLTVVVRALGRSSRTHAFWLCRCECGNYCVVCSDKWLAIGAAVTPLYT